RRTPMGMITTKDGTHIYYKDWGKGPVVTFSHGWPLNADAWDGQMLFLAQHGFRASLRRSGAAGKGPLRRCLQRACLDCGQGQYSRRASRVDFLRWTPDRVQLGRTDSGARPAADGGGPGIGRHGLVAAGGWAIDRQATRTGRGEGIP